MNHRWLDYSYIFATIVFTVYGQLVLKWRVQLYGQVPIEFTEKLKYMSEVLLDPWILSGFVGAFIASLAWIMAMTKFELTYAYPFMSLNFIVVLVLGGLFLSEQISLQKLLGVGFIMVGLMIASRG